MWCFEDLSLFSRWNSVHVESAEWARGFSFCPALWWICARQNCKHEGSLGLFWFLIKMFLARRTGKMGGCENGAYVWLKWVRNLPCEGFVYEGLRHFNCVIKTIKWHRGNHSWFMAFCYKTQVYLCCTWSLEVSEVRDHNLKPGNLTHYVIRVHCLQ